MAYYLKLPPHSGNAINNRTLVQITGISGVLNSVQYTLQENAPAFNDVARYIFDIRRLPDSINTGAGSNFILQTNTGQLNTTGTSNWRRNGVAIAAGQIFIGSAGDVMSFDVGVTPSGGAIALFARFNEVEHFFNLAVKEIKLTVAGVVHTFNMSSSNGNLNEFSSDTGTLTFKLFNAPANNSQWVFYDDGGADNESTVSYDLGAIGFAVSSQITAPAITATVSYDIGAIDYAVSAQQFAPGNNASLAYDIGAISYAVSAQQAAPQFAALVGYDIGSIGFSVQANTGIPANAATAAYDLGGIGYSISAQSVAPQLIASLAYEIGGIDYAVSANTGAPIRAATIGYDIGDISWQVDAQWQPSDALAIIGYDIGSIGFLVQARSGDVVVSSASDAGLSFKELARGLSFKEQPRGIKFTEPQRGVRV